MQQFVKTMSINEQKIKTFSNRKNYAALVTKYAIKHGLIDKDSFDLVDFPPLLRPKL